MMRCLEFVKHFKYKKILHTKYALYEKRGGGENKNYYKTRLVVCGDNNVLKNGQSFFLVADFTVLKMTLCIVLQNK